MNTIDQQAVPALRDLIAQLTVALAGLPFAVASRQRLQGLSERLISQSLNIAVLGQFKRGKSTLLNALLGVDLLPAAVVPVTALPIFVAYGPTPAVQILFGDGRPPEVHRGTRGNDLKPWLFAVAAEEANPQNRLAVSRINVYLPAPVLEDGAVFIDTPGIGSTHLHNTQTAIQLLPECDAALVVLSADPPITESEIAYLKEIRGHISRLYFLLNKIDYLSPPEQDQACAFLRDVLSQHLGEAPVIFCVSARQALAARLNGDEVGLRSSGIQTVDETVIKELAREKATLLEGAIAHKAHSALMLARNELALAGAALRLPLDELAKRRAAFEHVLPQLDQQLQDARDLLKGDHKRLAAALEVQATSLRDKANRSLEAVILSATREHSDHAEPAARTAVAAALPAFFQDALVETSHALDAKVSAVMGIHTDRATVLINSVWQNTAELFGITHSPLPRGGGLRIDRTPYWVSRDRVGTLIPNFNGKLDWALPTATRMKRLRRRLIEEASNLIKQNVENLRWTTLQNLDATFRHFQADLEEQYAQAVGAARQAIEMASIRQHNEADKIVDDLSHLSQIASAVDQADAALQSHFRRYDQLSPLEAR